MQIDVYHDIACPWCRIGKANLERALRQWDGEPVTITWQPFLLEQGLPEEGIRARDHYRHKFGPGQIDTMFDRVKAAGRNAGVDFDFASAIRAPSENAHRLILLAPEEQKRAVLDGLHRAYFNEGRNVADLDTLADIAAGAGLDRAETLARLHSDEGVAETNAALEHAYRLGITGVPFFVFDQHYALSGAQPPETILAAMQQPVADRAMSQQPG
jgi:predicted DsbA family dithiol-disulfide isomerase